MKKLVIGFLIITSGITFSQIKFDADFESGNLKSVFTQDSITYNVQTYEDIGGRWFYFRITGVMDKFIIVNVVTSPHDFTRAMYSYDDAAYQRFSEEESPMSGTFQKTFEHDTVFVAYYTPYTFKYLQSRIAAWKQNKFVKVDTLGYTKNLFPIQEIIITDPDVPNYQKQTVWIHARTHPGETPSSWHFDGIVQELLSDKDIVNYYLGKLEFRMIPFTNPDGVYFGKSRTNFDNVDVESNWNQNDLSTTKEVKILKTRMKELNDQKPFSVFLNLHSQASSSCTFWIHSSFSTSANYYRRENQFCNLNVSNNPYFVKEDFSESDLSSVFPEGWLWNNYGDQIIALTYETPYNNYFVNSSAEYIQVTKENLFEIGRRTVYAIAEYLDLSNPKYYLMDNNIAQISGNYTTYDVGTEFLGDDFVVLDANSGSSINYQSETLPSGNYDIAAWWPTSEGNSFSTVFEISAGSNNYEITKTQKLNGGQWNYLTSVELNNDGIISVKLNSNSTGLVVADAFRLIYTGSVTDINENMISTKFILYQNYPNPFNPTTTIKYSIPNLKSGLSNKVQLKIFNILGEEVTTLVNKVQSPGEYEATFYASDLASGTYFYRLQVGNNVETKKMVLVK